VTLFTDILLSYVISCVTAFCLLLYKTYMMMMMNQNCCKGFCFKKGWKHWCKVMNKFIE